jgi:predicted phosphodiesterase
MGAGAELRPCASPCSPTLFGAFPEETITLLRGAVSRAIAGDSDREVVAAAAGKLPAAGLAAKREGLQWAAATLSPPALAVLAGLPESARGAVAGRSALLVHGSPARLDEHLWPHTPEERLAELAVAAAADLVVCGHTHTPMDRRAGGVRFLNPGSVGRQSDGDPRAAWALLEIDENGEATFTPRRVAYDHHAAAAAVREKGLPEVVAEMLLQGRGLKDLLAG